MNLFEAIYTCTLVLVFIVVLAWVGGMHGWLAGLGAAVAVPALIVGGTMLLQRRRGR